MLIWKGDSLWSAWFIWMISIYIEYYTHEDCTHLWHCLKMSGNGNLYAQKVSVWPLYSSSCISLNGLSVWVKAFKRK
jgi:hypothetical protein